MFPTMRYLYSFRYRSNLDKSKEKNKPGTLEPYGKIRSSQNFVTLHYHKKYQRFDWQREASYIRYFIFYCMKIRDHV